MADPRDERLGPQWNCIVCTDLLITAENRPVYVEDYPYCVNCIEQQLRPIAEGNEHAGAPKIGDTPLSGIPGLLDRINPELRQEYESNLARIQEASPEQRIFCPNLVGGNDCNDYLGKRSTVSGDRKHQWTACTQCPAFVCQACGRAQTDNNRDAQDCAKPQWLLDWEKEHYSAEVGVKINFCPTCDRRIELNDGCNEINCICGNNFCFICGVRTVGGSHWSSGQTGCPRKFQPDDPEAWGDDPWQDAGNFGGLDFPPLKNGPELPWRQSAIRLRQLDSDIRQRRRRAVGSVDNPNPSESDVNIVKKLLLHARHLFTMMSNRSLSPMFGLTYGSPHPHQIFERLRFAHHATYLRWLMNGLFRREMDGLLETGIPWLEAFQHVRRLQFRNAVHGNYREEERRADLHALLLLLEVRVYQLDTDRPNVGAVLEADRIRVEKLCLTRKVLACCKSIAEILLRYRGRNELQFSASLSYYIHSQMDDLRFAMESIGNIGEDAFRRLGSDHTFACDVGSLFLYRLLEEQPNEYEQLVLDDERHWANDRIWVGDILRVLCEIEVEQQYLPNEELRTHVSELRVDIEMLQQALGQLAPTINVTGTVPLRMLGQLEPRYNELVMTEDIWPSVDKTVLRPLFFDVLRRTERVLAACGMHPRAAMPDALERPALYNWRCVRTIIRQIQYDIRGAAGGAHHLDMLALLRTLLFVCARSVRHRNVELLESAEVARTYQELHNQWKFCQLDESRDRPILWFPPARRQQEVRRLVTSMNDAIAESLAISSGMPPPCNLDHVVDGRPLRDWYGDLTFVYSLECRFSRDEDRYPPFYEVVRMTHTLLWKILGNEWDFVDRTDNADRVACLRFAVSTWGTDQEPWHMLLADGYEQQTMRELMHDLANTLERLFPNTIGLTQQQPNSLFDAGGA